MTIGANSYGSAGGVAALTPRFANTSGVFDGTTRPTLTQVESHIDQVSGTINAILATNGFKIPITQADCKLALDLFVNQEVASIVEGINGSGRFGPIKTGTQKSSMMLVIQDVQAFLAVQAPGFERLGATRTYSALEGVGFKDFDADGNETTPFFTRKTFLNEDTGGNDD